MMLRAAAIVVDRVPDPGHVRPAERKLSQ